MKRLFYDIEVSPNYGSFWRPGRKLTIDYRSIKKERAVICIGYKWEEDREATVLSWDRSQCDKKMLKTFSTILASADECVGHNIDRFDLPWVRTRCLIHKLQSFPPPRTCDTLKWARKLGFNSNRLDYLGQVLGIGCKIKTDHGLWDAVCWDDDRKALAQMMEYCANDVLLLQAVYGELSELFPPKTHVGVMFNHERWSCPYCGSDNVIKNRPRVSAKGVKSQQMKCKDCKRYYEISDKLREQYEYAA